MEEGSTDTEEVGLMVAARKGTASRPRGRGGWGRLWFRGRGGGGRPWFRGRGLEEVVYIHSCRRGCDSSWGCGAVCTTGLLL